MTGDRRAVRPDHEPLQRMHRADGMWRVGSFEGAQQVLRARHKTTQAGFLAGTLRRYLPRLPILFIDGPAHDEARRPLARFFAPAVVEDRYRGPLTEAARRRLDAAVAAGSADLAELSLRYVVEVTADIVGLSHPSWRDGPQRREKRVQALSRRLVGFFDQPPFDLTKPDLGRTHRDWAAAGRKVVLPLLTYYLADVAPAVRERRRRPQDDVITHLLAQGRGELDILVEAVTYGTAGMVTARELLTMAIWHLLTTPGLEDRWRAGSREDRRALLEEIARLEPVVDHLYRETTSRLTIHEDGQDYHIEAGELIDVQVRAANADPSLTADPLRRCPMRDLPKGVRSSVLTFGDGAHKCPGEHLAILEAEVLVTELLERSPVLVREPSIGWNDLVSGYELRGLTVRFEP